MLWSIANILEDDVDLEMRKYTANLELEAYLDTVNELLRRRGEDVTKKLSTGM